MRMRHDSDDRTPLDETPPGGTPTPGEDIVDEIGEILGVTYDDGERLRAGDKEHDRDIHRWELDPASADDYADRCGVRLSFAERLRHLGGRR